MDERACVIRRGDVVVLECPQPLSEETVTHLRHQVLAWLADQGCEGTDVLVLDSGVRLAGVLRVDRTQ